MDTVLSVPAAPTGAHPSLPSSLNTIDLLKSTLIIFVVGGPGCGKGTQCKNMATKYGFCHVGLGQLLRQEAQRNTQRGRQIRDIMQQGLLVPTVRAHGQGKVSGGTHQDKLPRIARAPGLATVLLH